MKSLYEYIKDYPNDEVTVLDAVYDVEIYFTYEEDVNNDDKKWDRAMMNIAKKITVKEVLEDCKVVVNLSDIIEKNIDNGTFEELFIENDVDSIMEDMQNIMSGCVSEKWMVKFAESLC